MKIINTDVLFLDETDVQEDFKKICLKNPELWQSINLAHLKLEYHQKILKADVVIFSGIHASVIIKSRF